MMSGQIEADTKSGKKFLQNNHSIGITAEQAIRLAEDDFDPFPFECRKKGGNGGV